MITIPAPFDAHCHFRQGDLLSKVVHYHDRVFEYALAMPNTMPPIETSEQVVEYRHNISSYCKRMKPLIAIKLTPKTTPDILIEAKEVGVIAAKLYPQDVTTNSEDGFSAKMLQNMRHDKRMLRIFKAMEEIDMVLCVHGEMPGEFCLDREKEFLYPLRGIVKKFSDLRVVLEHITTRDSVCFVKDFDNVAATITLHHLAMTLDDVVGDKIAPHNFCKPIAKRPGDRKALRKAVLSQHPRFFFGSDSAPHLRKNKERTFGCAGCFTGPLLLEGLADLLSDYKDMTDKDLQSILKTFTSDNGRNWYGLTEPTYHVKMGKDEWKVPDEVDGIVPFWAGRTLKWKVLEGEVANE